MKKKIFGDKKINIRKIGRKDLGRAKQFQNFFNSFIEEEAKLFVNEKITLKKQREILEETVKLTKKKKIISLIAEEKGEIAGRLYLKIGSQRGSHVAVMGGVMIAKKFRRMGLAKHLIKEGIGMVKKELKPSPRIIKLSVFGNNEPAFRLYEKMGFKKVAIIPKQLKYKNRYVDEIIMIYDIK